MTCREITFPLAGLRGLRQDLEQTRPGLTLRQASPAPPPSREPSTIVSGRRFEEALTHIAACDIPRPCWEPETVLLGAVATWPARERGRHESVACLLVGALEGANAAATGKERRHPRKENPAHAWRPGYRSEAPPTGGAPRPTRRRGTRSRKTNPINQLPHEDGPRRSAWTGSRGEHREASQLCGSLGDDRAGRAPCHWNSLDEEPCQR